MQDDSMTEAAKGDDFEELKHLLATLELARRDRRRLAIVMGAAILSMVIVISLIYGWRTKSISEVGREVANNPEVRTELTEYLSPAVSENLAENDAFTARLEASLGEAALTEFAELKAVQMELGSEVKEMRKLVAVSPDPTLGLREQIDQLRQTTTRSASSLSRRIEESAEQTATLVQQVDKLRSVEPEKMDALNARLDAMQAAIDRLEARSVAARDLSDLVIASKGELSLPPCGVSLNLRGWRRGGLRVRVLASTSTADEPVDIVMHEGESTTLGGCNATLLERWSRLFGPDVVALRVHPIEARSH